MIRTFCDVCDKQIDDGDRIFRVELTETTSGVSDLLIGREYVSPNSVYSQVCKTCDIAILGKILSMILERSKS